MNFKRKGRRRARGRCWRIRFGAAGITLAAAALSRVPKRQAGTGPWTLEFYL